MMYELIHPIWNEWNDRYSQPHRHYHRPSHVFHMFNVAQKMGLTLDENEVLAIWLHDIIYDPANPGPISNEERSAKYAIEYINSHPHVKRRVSHGKVADIILDTEKHVSRLSTDRISRQVIDLDLWILSEFSEEVYKAYVSLVAEEYIPLFGVDDFIQGRAEWIDSMLCRDSIYLSKYVPLHIERNARRNLRVEECAMNCPEKYRAEYLQIKESTQ